MFEAGGGLRAPLRHLTAARSSACDSLSPLFGPDDPPQAMISDQTLLRWLSPQTVRLVGDAVRALLWAAVIGMAAVFLPIYVRIWRLTINQPGSSDFTIFYYTARMVADGLPMYGASPAKYGVHWATGHLGNLNPPHFQLLLQPLAQFTYGQAYVVWTSLNLAALLIA